MSGRGAEIPLLACRSLYPSFVVALAGFRFLLPFAVTRSPHLLVVRLASSTPAGPVHSIYCRA